MSSEPRRIRESVERVARDFGMADPGALATVTTSWVSIVGDAVAAHSAPLNLRDGVLAIDVDDGAWATQLRYLEADVIADLGAAGIAVSRLRVRVSRKP